MPRSTGVFRTGGAVDVAAVFEAADVATGVAAVVGSCGPVAVAEPV
jgi:hypothetical protein